MGIEQLDVLDVVSLRNNASEVVLTIADFRDWSEEKDEHLRLLYEKLFFYINTFSSDDLVNAYPLAAGKPVVVSVVFRVPPIPDALRLIARCQKYVGDAGTFEWSVFSGEVEPSDGSEEPSARTRSEMERRVASPKSGRI